MNYVTGISYIFELLIIIGTFLFLLMYGNLNRLALWENDKWESWQMNPEIISKYKFVLILMFIIGVVYLGVYFYLKFFSDSVNGLLYKLLLLFIVLVIIVIIIFVVVVGKEDGGGEFIKNHTKHIVWGIILIISVLSIFIINSFIPISEYITNFESTFIYIICGLFIGIPLWNYSLLGGINKSYIYYILIACLFIIGFSLGGIICLNISKKKEEDIKIGQFIIIALIVLSLLFIIVTYYKKKSFYDDEKNKAVQSKIESWTGIEWDNYMSEIEGKIMPNKNDTKLNDTKLNDQ